MLQKMNSMKKEEEKQGPPSLSNDSSFKSRSPPGVSRQNTAGIVIQQNPDPDESSSSSSLNHAKGTLSLKRRKKNRSPDRTLEKKGS